MSDFCPHCDDFFIDASRARRTDNHEAKEEPKKNGFGAPDYTCIIGSAFQPRLWSC
jgi:hypothetical protein